MTDLSRSILIVDDDADIRETLSEVLQDEGFRVVTAANGFEALIVLRGSQAPSMVLLDLMMPVMDGFRFLEERKKDPALASVPVAVITASGNIEVDKARLERIPVVRKPFELPQLMTVLEHLSFSQAN